MCAFHGAHPAGVLRTSKSAPGRFVSPAGAGACPVLDTGTETIAVAMVEGARARWRQKDQRDKSAGRPICTAIAARRVASKDGRNERIKRSV